MRWYNTFSRLTSEVLLTTTETNAFVSSYGCLCMLGQFDSLMPFAKHQVQSESQIHN